MDKNIGNELTVVQHNDLIESSYRLDLDEMRLINLALTKINSKNANIGMIEIYPEEFAEKYNINKKNVWRNMKNSVVGLMQKPIKLKIKDASGRTKVRLLSWLAEAQYYVDQSDGSKIQIEFSRKIEPYLFELKGNFTAANFEYGSYLNTSFSYRLYQWLICDMSRKRSKSCELTMTLDEIKERGSIDNESYSRWSNFKDWVIVPAVNLITQKTNLVVSYTQNLRGRAVYSITFKCVDEFKIVASGGQIEWSDQKPARPVLKRRPHVTKESHDEGEWQKANLKVLRQYQTDLRSWDSNAKLSIRDLQKLIDYSRLFSPETHENAVLEMASRKSKKRKK